MLRVAETFLSLQGEGTFTGTPMLFVRLQGCSVGCPWCDTKYTWDHADGTAMTEQEIVALVLDQVMAQPRLCLTGGEPLEQDIRELIRLTAEAGISVHLETSGTAAVPALSDMPWITLSPKIGMPGGLAVRADVVAAADEIKMPIGKAADVDKLRAFLAQHDTRGVPIFVQPLSMSEKATALCVDAATRNGWRVSVQVHKFIGMR